MAKRALAGVPVSPPTTAEPVVQRKALSSGGASHMPLVTRLGAGRPLDAETRGHFEPRFGFDFSRVRVHADGEAERAAAELRARAFTVEQHVVFGSPQPVIGSEEGRRLIAHELAHVVQQQSGPPRLQRQADDTLHTTCGFVLDSASNIDVTIRKDYSRTWWPIEKAAGHVMARAERYDAFLRSRGIAPKRIDLELAGLSSNGDEYYLSDQEFLAEFRCRCDFWDRVYSGCGRGISGTECKHRVNVEKAPLKYGGSVPWAAGGYDAMLDGPIAGPVWGLVGLVTDNPRTQAQAAEAGNTAWDFAQGLAGTYSERPIKDEGEYTPRDHEPTKSNELRVGPGGELLKESESSALELDRSGNREGWNKDLEDFQMTDTDKLSTAVQRPGFGPASTERGGTGYHTGKSFHEYSEAEAAIGLRVDWDNQAGRPRKITYNFTAGAAAVSSQMTERSFHQESRLKGESAQSKRSAYTNSGFDKAHLAQRAAGKVDPAVDEALGLAGPTGPAVERALDVLSNVAPMVPELNRGGPWLSAEARTVEYATREGYVTVEITPIYDAQSPRLRDGTPIPKQFRRVIRAGPTGKVLEVLTFDNK